MAAYISVLQITIRLYSLNTLKQKRAIMRPIKDRLRNSFNVSVIEAAELDSLDRGVILIVGICDSPARASSLRDNLVNFVERNFPQLDLFYDNEIIRL